ncbi:transposase, partial [Candidatus Woesearchaeota archaeon]|nr:transposase [Candidatus Woesearchaeota archaeon]
AASAGKLLIPVATKGTTQRCSQCQTIVPKELWQRTHECSNCGFTAPRDYNSALEIKRLTLKEIGWDTAESTLVEMEQAAPSLKQEAPLF